MGVEWDVKPYTLTHAEKNFKETLTRCWQVASLVNLTQLAPANSVDNGIGEANRPTQHYQHATSVIYTVNIAHDSTWLSGAKCMRLFTRAYSQPAYHWSAGGVQSNTSAGAVLDNRAVRIGQGYTVSHDVTPRFVMSGLVRPASSQCYFR